MLEELNLDNTEDKDHPEELTEYEWAWFHTTVPSPYDCQYCRHYKDVYGDGNRICSLYHCPYTERELQIKEDAMDSYGRELTRYRLHSLLRCTKSSATIAQTH